MEDDRTIDPPPPSEGERAEAEDRSPQDGPADPADDPETEGVTETGTDQTAASEDTPAPQRSVTGELPRTTTTGDDEQDLRSAGDGAVSGAPGDDLDDPSQRHE